MSKITKYFNELKKAEGLESDYKVAQYLGVSKQYAYKVRDTGRLSDALCIKIAKALEINPMEIVSLREHEKAKDKDAKKMWLDLHNEIKLTSPK